MQTKHKPRLRPLRKTKYKYRDPNKPKTGQKLPHCFLCKKWLKAERYNVGVCPECEVKVRDPRFAEFARKYFNDPEYYKRVLTTIEILRATEER